MDASMKLPYRPSDLAYYTTWWLPSTSSVTSQSTTSSEFDNLIPIYEYRKDAKQDEDQFNSPFCIPLKSFRLKHTKGFLTLFN